MYLEVVSSEKFSIRVLVFNMKNKTMTAFWGRKVVKPLQGFLTQGLSCKKLALSLAFGVTLGTFPMLGVTTVLCTLTELILKLNLPVIQFANYLVYPLQILLLVPYYHLGDLIFNAQQNIDFGTLKDILIGNTNKEMITMLLESTLYAAGAWLLISPLTLALLYTGIKPALIRLNSASTKLKFFRR
jgi:hypothetical protein